MGFMTYARSLANPVGRPSAGESGAETDDQLELGPLEHRIPTRIYYSAGPGIAIEDTFSWIDFAIGFGDAASAGITIHIRDQWGVGSPDYTSESYRYGSYGGNANLLAIGGGWLAGVARLGAVTTVTRWGGSGSWYMVGPRSTSSWYLSGQRWRHSYQSSTTLQVKSSRLSYPSGWEWIKGTWGQRILIP